MTLRDLISVSPIVTRFDVLIETHSLLHFESKSKNLINIQDKEEEKD